MINPNVVLDKPMKLCDAISVMLQMSYVLNTISNHLILINGL